MFRKIVVPLLVSCLALVLTMVVCGFPRFSILIDLPTFMLGILPPFALASIGFGLRRTKLAYTAPFRSGSGVKDQESSIAYFNSLLAYLAAFATLGLAMGFVALMYTLAESDGANVGPNVAVALLSVFWAAFFVIIIALPFRTAAASRLAELRADSDAEN